MARSIPVIYNQLLQQKNTQTALNNLNSTSQVSIWNLWLWITAVGQNLFEQLCDLFQANIESQIANAPVFTPQWIVQMCKLFQYSASNPQYVQLNTSQSYPYLSISYPIVNSSLCPITQAAVVATTNKELLIKVASNSTPLSSAQITALGSYLNEILTPDTHYTIMSLNADSVMIQAQVYYNASYSGVISASMNAAINTYLANIPFNGVFTVSDLETAMLNVTGVDDVVLQNIYWRTYTQGLSGLPSGGPPPTNSYYAGQILVSDYTLIYRNYQTYAGYVVAESTTGYTPSDLIIYTPS
jgi:hypothetical protein